MKSMNLYRTKNISQRISPKKVKIAVEVQKPSNEETKQHIKMPGCLDYHTITGENKPMHPQKSLFNPLAFSPP